MQQPDAVIVKPKPKFAPKIPAVKKESDGSTGNDASVAPTADASTANASSASAKSGYKGNNSNNNRGGGRGRGHNNSNNNGGEGGRGGRGGRGTPWSMPLGPLFFSAGATQNPHANNSHSSSNNLQNNSSTNGNNALRVMGGAKSASTAGAIMPRVARPNEMIVEDELVMHSNGRIAAPTQRVKADPDAMSTSSASANNNNNPSPHLHVKEESSDSDASEPETAFPPRKRDTKKKPSLPASVTNNSIYTNKEEDADNSESEEDRVFLENDNNYNGSSSSNNNAVYGEQWPPRRYATLSPVTLPIGPKTGTLRRLLQQLPILAHPEDSEGLRHEAENALFLMQLPSDLNLRHLLDEQNAHNHSVHSTSAAAAAAATHTSMNTAMDVDDNTTTNHHNNNTTTSGTAQNMKRPVFRLGPKGQLGKLQLLKSGRVRLLIPNNAAPNTNTTASSSGSDKQQEVEVMAFDVGAGLMTSFYQDLLAIQTPSATNNTNTNATTTTTNSNSSSNSSSHVVKTETTDSNINTTAPSIAVLGNITRKLVVTPPFAVLGEKKAKLSSTAYLTDALVAAQAEQTETALLQDGAQTLGFTQYLERLNAGSGDITKPSK